MDELACKSQKMNKNEMIWQEMTSSSAHRAKLVFSARCQFYLCLAET